MNSGFEDGLILDEMLEKHNNDMGLAFEEISKTRPAATDALSDLSLRNYVEMRSLTAKTWFVYKKKFERVTFCFFFIFVTLWGDMCVCGFWLHFVCQSLLETTFFFGVGF